MTEALDWRRADDDRLVATAGSRTATLSARPDGRWTVELDGTPVGDAGSLAEADARIEAALTWPGFEVPLAGGDSLAVWAPSSAAARACAEALGLRPAGPAVPCYQPLCPVGRRAR